MIDHPFGGVLDGNDAIVDGPRLHFPKHFIDGRHGQADGAFTEMLQRGLLGEGAFRPEISHLDRLLQRQAGRHDFAKQPRHFFGVQRPLVQRHDTAQHLGFALRTVEHRILVLSQLDVSHLLGTVGPLTDQTQDIAIQLVDTLTQVVEIDRRIGHGG